mgnify:CR=1 FL=1|tara:strand:+ start:1609 stop:2556 length:948 start_codon:yes stop_codon:yes gene_type:complete
MDNKKIISWIVPCFNEEKVIFETLKRIKKVSTNINQFNWELILIDDGSRDNTKKIIKEIKKYPFKIILLSFSRNFGHQQAVQAGLDNCSGSASIIIDADLQDPPEIAKKMIEKWEKGYQVVYGQRTIRRKENFLKKFSAFTFYRLLNFLSGVKIPLDTGDFRLVDRTVIDALKKFPEKGRFMRGLIAWIGFKQISVKYIRDPRFAGTTKYSLKKMVSFAIEGLTNFSRKPLRLATFTGFIFSLFAFVGMAYVLYIRFFTQSWVAGWAAICMTILLSSGIQLIFIGLLGEYIGNIFFETKNRPLYIIEERFIINER